MKEVLLEKLSHVLTIGSGRDGVNPALWLRACALHPVLTTVGERQGRGLHTSPVYGVDLGDVPRGISAGEGPDAALQQPTVPGGDSLGEWTRCRVGPTFSHLNFFEQNSLFLPNGKRSLTYKTDKVCLTRINWFYKFKCIIFTHYEPDSQKSETF